MKKTIYLLKIGETDPGILIILKKNLKWFFKKYKIKIDILTDVLPLLESEHNSVENNYDVIGVKKRLISQFKNRNYYRILGIMDVDIHSRISIHIFGVADPPRNKSFATAIISTLRLKEDGIYRRVKNVALFELRVLKEAIHELGHTFSLNHCNNRCVMRSSQSIEDIDRKPHDFCEICLKKLDNYLNNAI
jgi:archaemetzincin